LHQKADGLICGTLGMFAESKNGVHVHCCLKENKNAGEVPEPVELLVDCQVR
jgi:hypothetical protein